MTRPNRIKNIQSSPSFLVTYFWMRLAQSVEGRVNQKHWGNTDEACACLSSPMLRTDYSKDLFGSITGFVWKNWYPSFSYTVPQTLMQLKTPKATGGSEVCVGWGQTRHRAEFSIFPNRSWLFLGWKLTWKSPFNPLWFLFLPFFIPVIIVLSFCLA